MFRYFEDLPDADESKAAEVLGWEPEVGSTVWVPGPTLSRLYWQAALVVETTGLQYKVQIWNRCVRAYTTERHVGRVFPRFARAEDL